VRDKEAENNKTIASIRFWETHLANFRETEKVKTIMVKHSSELEVKNMLLRKTESCKYLDFSINQVTYVSNNFRKKIVISLSQEPIMDIKSEKNSS